MHAQNTAGEFDADRQRHLHAFAERLADEAERLTWPLERLHRLRDERLRALVRTAKARSPWHAQRLAGVDVDALTGADLAAIPTMTKTDVMEHWDEIVTDRRLTHTTGVAGVAAGGVAADPAGVPGLAAGVGPGAPGAAADTVGVNVPSARWP